MIILLLAISIVPGCSQPGQETSLIPAPGSPVSVPFSPGGVALGDVNGDAKTDLVVRSSDTSEVIVLLGLGDGRFKPAAGNPIKLLEHASEIALGDLNNDGWLDLVIGCHDSYSLELHLGDGNGYFRAAAEPFYKMKDGARPHTHGLAVGDLNNDGNLDLVTGNTTDADVAVALGDGSGSFARAPASPFSVGQGPYPLTLGDMDQDGFLDIVVTSTLNGNGQSGESLTLLLGDGRGGFERTQVPVRTLDPWFVAIGDINHDSIPDLASTHWERDELTILIGNGNGTFTEVQASPFDLGQPAWYIEIADVDGDGNNDVVAASDDSVRVMLGDGQGGFRQAAGPSASTGGGSWRLAVGDIDGDGRDDVVTSDLAANSLTILLAK